MPVGAEELKTGANKELMAREVDWKVSSQLNKSYEMRRLSGDLGRFRRMTASSQDRRASKARGRLKSEN